MPVRGPRREAGERAEASPPDAKLTKTGDSHHSPSNNSQPCLPKVLQERQEVIGHGTETLVSNTKITKTTRATRPMPRRGRVRRRRPVQAPTWYVMMISALILVSLVAVLSQILGLPAVVLLQALGKVVEPYLITFSGYIFQWFVARKGYWKIFRKRRKTGEEHTIEWGFSVKFTVWNGSSR